MPPFLFLLRRERLKPLPPKAFATNACYSFYMQHACHQCGAPVDDGTPFCKQCNAPQIRVATAMQAPVEPVRTLEREEAPQAATLPMRSSPIEWRSAFPAAFFVAVPA